MPSLASIHSILRMTKIAQMVTGLLKWVKLIKTSNHKKLVQIWYCSLECLKLVPLHLQIKVRHKFQKPSTWTMLTMCTRSTNWKRSDCHWTNSEARAKQLPINTDRIKLMSKNWPKHLPLLQLSLVWSQLAVKAILASSTWDSLSQLLKSTTTLKHLTRLKPSLRTTEASKRLSDKLTDSLVRQRNCPMTAISTTWRTIARLCKGCKRRAPWWSRKTSSKMFKNKLSFIRTNARAICSNSKLETVKGKSSLWPAISVDHPLIRMQGEPQHQATIAAVWTTCKGPRPEVSSNL